MTCRKAHASAFNPFLVFRRAQVELTGDLTSWRGSASYERRFCPACGSQVVGVDIGGTEAELSTGSFDEPGRFAPQYECWTVRREPWLAPLPVPQHAGDRTPG